MGRIDLSVKPPPLQFTKMMILPLQMILLFFTTLRLCAASGADVEKREAVKSAFLYNYDNYMKYAYPKDVLDVENLVGADDGATAGFGSVPIESLSTMIVMNLTSSDYFKKALEVVQNQSFTNTNVSADDSYPPGTVKLFELTIRLIGGMLSAYEMNGKKSEEVFLINKTKVLADRLKGAFNNQTKIPVSIWNINSQSAFNESDFTNCAEAGTLTLEWDRLSNYTNDDRYRKLAIDSVDTLRQLPAHFPGLPYLFLYPKTLKPFRKYVTVGGGFDSYLEYLIKYPALLGQADHPYIQTWETAVESIQKYMVHQTSVNNFTFLGDYDVSRNTSVLSSSHLACFFGGNLAMGGRLLHNDEFTTLGLQLIESCSRTYFETELGIGPYFFGYADAKTNNFTGLRVVLPGQKEFYQNHGMFVSFGYWSIAPEVIESVFYAWRITGHQMWRDIAWKIFLQIKKVADTGHGFAPITDVNDDSTGLESDQPGFMYSETLKYFYLIFDDTQRYSLDDIAFNTEGMPFKRTKSKGFGSIQGTFSYSPSHYVQNHSGEWVPNPSSSSTTDLSTGGNSEASTIKLNEQTTINKLQLADQMESMIGMPKEVAMVNLYQMK